MNNLFHFSRPKCFILLLFMMMSFMICMKTNEAYALTSLVEQPSLQETVEQVSEPVTDELDTQVVPSQEDFDHEMIEPVIQVVDEAVDEAVDPIIIVAEEAVDEVVNEIKEPIIGAVVESFDPIIDVVNETTELVVEVIDETSDKATEVVRETTEPIVKLDDVIIKPKKISNGWMDRLVPAVGELNNIPVSNQKPLKHQPSKIVLNHNVTHVTGSSTTDQSGSSGGNIMGYIKAKTLLSKSIIVTLNYAHDFILMNQWSNAPPGQPPKTTSSQPHMNL